ncbi:SGNH/GDSL hydrolase family protein [Pelagicoccus mobilis]|uniref:SGNH/GDSL hydrolase family protein n=1 Tax=Pelagicoccus mobilis TaxID=415221 RepID=A0A934S079_9BACT|nr:SGNH/GDSL hydrolase family protein [Pelagicoccus mobilis]MBK1879911.1 SGNH/GDSL hydrolase family protein [Pelagicoccus mobilis]
MKKRVFWGVGSLLLSGLAFAGSSEEAWQELIGERFAKRIEFAYVENDPDLPNVLIYGDSISIAYTPRVRQNLDGKANVYRLYCNGGDSSSFVGKMEKMHDTMRDETLDAPWSFEWDVIHFNVGLHDLKYLADKKLNKEEGTQVSTIGEYKRNLSDIVSYLKKSFPRAKLVFATTTPVPEGEPGRFAGDAKRYNAAALEVLGNHEDIVINDLYSFTLPNQPKWWIRAGDVHYNVTGKTAQGDRVASVLLDNLK